jgi:hypothetical protein
MRTDKRSSKKGFIVTTLLSALHDSDGKLIDAISLYLPELQRIYDSIVVVVTDTTDGKVIDLLGEAAKVQAMGGLAQARRMSINFGLQTQADHFHYCDFDRVLYWIINYPDELRSVVNHIPLYDFVVFGRTEQAFNTHPELQRITELECNRLFGYNVDILSGSRGLSRPVAQKIVAESTANGAGVDAEWLLIAERFRYIECNGLAYESASFGIEKSDNEELETRIKNLNDIRSVMQEYTGKQIIMTGDNLFRPSTWAFQEKSLEQNSTWDIPSYA